MKKKGTITFISITAILVLLIIILSKTLISNTISGRIHFPNDRIGQVLSMEDGEIFEIFRELTVSGKNNNDHGLAVFKVRFRFAGLEPGINKSLSMIPTPFLIGMKGFRGKYWMYNEDTGYFQGIYQWESREQAEKYPDSFIFNLMTKRSAFGTLSYEILPDTELAEYIQERLSD